MRSEKGLVFTRKTDNGRIEYLSHYGKPDLVHKSSDFEWHTDIMFAVVVAADRFNKWPKWKEYHTAVFEHDFELIPVIQGIEEIKKEPIDDDLCSLTLKDDIYDQTEKSLMYKLDTMTVNLNMSLELGSRLSLEDIHDYNKTYDRIRKITEERGENE